MTAHAPIPSEPRIIRNVARCLLCGDTVESLTVHDFRMCSCRSLAVDGGTQYIKRSGNPRDIEELSEVEYEVAE